MKSYPPARYDRSVTPAFLVHFERHGFAEPLLDYARAQYPIDLQFRKNPKSGAQHATLYVGMTAVLNIVDKGARGYELSAHHKYTLDENGWMPAWQTPRLPDWWAAHWAGVEEYLERIIPQVVRGRLATREGLVQSAVSVFRGDATRVMLDREVIPGFVDDPTRKRVVKGFSDALVEAVSTAGIPGRPPNSFGQKCDLLAIHRDGHLEAIEVKPENVDSLAWVPAQATMYARLLNYWIENDTQWEGAVRRMFAQRERLGLVPEGFALPQTIRPHVFPAVAFPRTASGPYVDRMFQVQRHLVATGAGDSTMTFYRASISGRLTPESPPKS